MKITAFGEILWDIFPDKKAIGGAPFNFSAHAARLGADSALISAVGDDELGKSALCSANDIGVDTGFVAVAEAPTGFCAVTLKDGQPEYDLRKGVAYDMIPNPAEPIKSDLFYFGTLALRGDVSRMSLSKILENGSFGEILCDLNIRQHYYNDEIINYCLRSCTWLKISDEDASVFEAMGYNCDAKTLCSALSHNFNINTVIYTCGADGAMIYDASRNIFYERSALKVNVASSVGAGDSFAACYAVSRLSGNSVEKSLENAVRLSAFVVSKTEAIPEYDETVRDLCFVK